jgi:hypothetical protein
MLYPNFRVGGQSTVRQESTSTRCQVMLKNGIGSVVRDKQNPTPKCSITQPRSYLPSASLIECRGLI